MKTPAWQCSPQAIAERDLANPSIANNMWPWKRQRRWIAWTFAFGVLAAWVLAVTPEVAFGQRGGGGGSHGGGGVSHSSGGSSAHSSADSSHTQSTATARPSSNAGTPRSASVRTASVSAGSTMAGSSRMARPASVHFGSNAVAIANRDRPPDEGSGRNVTIGFPPRSPDELRVSSSTGGDRATFVGEGNQLWEEQVPHGSAATAAQHARTPITTTQSAQAPRGPASNARLAMPLKPVGKADAGTSPSFLAEHRGISNPPHIWRPRHNPRVFYGGFGFFGFGFGYPVAGLGFGPGCDPFWADSWAFGCDTFGYWGGYGAGYDAGVDAGVDQAQGQQEMDQPSQEPALDTYVPAPESSPEEIQAERILVVLFMKDGAVYAVTDYWIADGKLHYLTSYGGENTIEIADLDLQKTVDVNAKRGVNFTLKPSPDQNQPNAPQPQPNPLEQQD